MKESAKLENIEPELAGLVLISHGTFAIGLLDSLRLITGQTKNVMALVLEEGDIPKEFSDKVFEVIDNFTSGAIIFIDILGGTPSNLFLLGANKISKPYLAFSGMNLPMVLEAAMMRSAYSFEQISEEVMSSGKDSIINLNEVVRKLIEDE